MDETEKTDDYYLIEIKTSKGWEIHNTFFDLEDAIFEFENETMRGQVRLTSPASTSNS